jgi:hypothetical protein
MADAPRVTRIKKYIRDGFDKRLPSVFTVSLWRIYRTAVMLSPSFRDAAWLKAVNDDDSKHDNMVWMLENRTLYVHALRHMLLDDWNNTLEERVQQFRRRKLERQADQAAAELKEATAAAQVG